MLYCEIHAKDFDQHKYMLRVILIIHHLNFYCFTMVSKNMNSEKMNPIDSYKLHQMCL